MLVMKTTTKTKVGDRVRICWNGWEGRLFVGSAMLGPPVRVDGVTKDGDSIKVQNSWFRSWVRVGRAKG